ncbi:hypothetical protein JKP88DRAFT_252092 [Tribonema minus]|uniref:Uncharacterized protein n=1 Tax=Tribonema minus TaxID=303371 RepID=A0A835ZCT5_9STRA|nr:hypothetical protein JKP88DRAFT_252092 [Tribonema minus]
MTGQAEWVPFKSSSEVNTVSEYKLPSQTDREVIYKGELMKPFVGSMAYFRPEKALSVYWNGGGFYALKDGASIEAPLSFVKCFPLPTDRTRKYYPGSLRPMGDMPPQEVWDKAWENAVFVAEDTYTMPGKTHVLVIVDPTEEFEGATTERMSRLMRTYAGQRKADSSGRVVAHQLDPTGRLTGLVVDDGHGGTKVVEEGALWVTDMNMSSVTDYNRQMQLKLRQIKQTDAPPQDKIDATRAYEADADACASDSVRSGQNVNAQRDAFHRRYVASFADPNDAKHGKDPATDALARIMDPNDHVLGYKRRGQPRNLLKFVRNMSRDTIPANSIVNFALRSY